MATDFRVSLDLLVRYLGGDWAGPSLGPGAGPCNREYVRESGPPAGRGLPSRSHVGKGPEAGIMEETLRISAWRRPGAGSSAPLSHSRSNPNGPRRSSRSVDQG